MKRFVAFVLALMLAILPATAENAYEKLNSMYMEASLLMVEGKYEEAARMFDSLSGYSDSAQMAIYIRCIALAEAGEYQSAIDSLKKLGDFKDASFMADYYKAVQLLEGLKTIPLETTDLEKLREAVSSCDNAVKAFRQIRVYKDSAAKADEAEKMKEDLKARYDTQYAYEKSHTYKSIGVSYNGAVSVCDEDGRYGMIFGNGEERIECKYDYVGYYSEGWINVSLKNENFFIDRDENVVLNDEMLSDSAAYLLSAERSNDSVLAMDRWGYHSVTTDGKVSGFFTGDYYDFRTNVRSQRMIITVMPGRGGTYYMLIDENRNNVSEVQYEKLSFVSDELLYAQKGGVSYLLDLNGKVIAQLDKDISTVDAFHEGIARIRGNNGLYGFINTEGEIVIPMEYSIVGESSDQLIWTENGWINHNNELVISADRISESDFRNGYAYVNKIRGTADEIIDREGNTVYTLNQDYENILMDEMLLCLDDDTGIFSVYDMNGNVIYGNEQSAYVLFKYDDGEIEYQYYKGNSDSKRMITVTAGGGYLYLLDDGWLSIYDLNGEKVF